MNHSTVRATLGVCMCVLTMVCLSIAQPGQSYRSTIFVRGMHAGSPLPWVCAALAVGALRRRRVPTAPQCRHAQGWTRLTYIPKEVPTT
jgi:hypothetical protein